MQLCRFWRAKQNGGTIIKNQNYRILNQNYPKLFIVRQIERIKRKHCNIAPR